MLEQVPKKKAASAAKSVDSPSSAAAPQYSRAELRKKNTQYVMRKEREELAVPVRPDEVRGAHVFQMGRIAPRSFEDERQVRIRAVRSDHAEPDRHVAKALEKTHGGRRDDERSGRRDRDEEGLVAP